MLQVKEYTKFFGGITEKDIPGSEYMYSVGDNLLIDHDGQLFQRPGFDIFSSTAYQLPAATRVNKLINFDIDSELISAQTKNIYYISGGVWTSLLGPTSNNPFNSNTAASLIEEGQWAHHLFLVSDSGNRPIKIYRDGSNNLKLRTAGLPKYQTPDALNAAAQLAAAIALAKDIRDSMKAHANDYGVSPAAHLAKDNTLYTAMNTLADPTDLASLIAATKTLRTNYDLHVDDAQAAPAFQAYHIQLSDETGTTLGYVQNPILNQNSDVTLPADAAITTLARAVLVLNDIRNRYNWHAMAPITHNNAIPGGASWGAHYVASTTLDLAAKYPTIAPNTATLLRYVNYLKAQYNAHLALAAGFTAVAGFGHRIADTTHKIDLADATDLHGAVGLMALLEYFYSEHYRDANFKNTNLYNLTDNYTVYTGATTAGNPTIAGVTPDPTTADPPLTSSFYLARAGSNTTNPYSWLAQLFPIGAKISSVTATTITMNANATNSDVGAAFAFSKGKYHYDIDRTPAAKTTSAYAAKLFLDTIDLSLSDMDSIATFAKQFAVKYKAHETGQALSVSNANMLTDTSIAGSATRTIYYMPTTFTGDQYVPHVWLSYATVWPYTSTGIVNEINGGETFFDTEPDSASFNYRFLYRYDYTVGQVSFQDFSTPSDVLNITSGVSDKSLTNGIETARDTVAISNIPVLANTSGDNWDTSTIKIEVYRTKANGSVYRKIGEVTNGTTTFTDNIRDAQIDGEGADVDTTYPKLYTTGGVVDNDVPPTCKHFCILDDVGYYANILSDSNTEAFPNRVMQSLPSDIDSVPATFYDDFDEEVTGIGSTRSNIIVFCKKSTYRLEGGFNELGQGGLSHERIADSTGCVAAQGIVKGDNGLFFPGQDGFYYTDGYQVIRLTGELEDTYRSYVQNTNQKNRLTGTYDNLRRRIYWTLQTTTGASSADIMWVLDLNFGIKKDLTPVTTMSGFTPASITYYLGNLHIGDSDGYIFAQNQDSNMDWVKDTSVAATSWNRKTIMYDYESCHDPFGSQKYRKYFTRVTAQFKQSTNLSVQPVSNADKGRVISNLPIIRSRRLLNWGDPKIDWTSTYYTAKDGNVIDEFRRFKFGSLRSNFRSIGFKNAYCVIAASDQMGNINVANISTHVWSLTLINTPTYKWPAYSVGYYVRIGGVDYPITVRTSDSVVRVDDTGLTALSVQTNIPFEIWGYPKNENFHMIGYSVDFDLNGDMEKPYQGATSLDGGQNV